MQVWFRYGHNVLSGTVVQSANRVPGYVLVRFDGSVTQLRIPVDHILRSLV